MILHTGQRLILLIALFFGPCAVAASGLDGDGLNDSVFRIFSLNGRQQGSGTAFLINREGYLITNHHVIEQAKRIVIARPVKEGKPKFFEASVITTSPVFDLAVLKVENFGGNPLSISNADLKKGDVVYTIGFPGIADRVVDTTVHSMLESTLTQGIVGRVITAAWERDAEKLTIVQHSASVNSGNSGGPLLDRCGRVIGINTAKAKGFVESTPSGRGVVNQSDGIFYASHASALIPLLNAGGITFVSSQIDCAESLSSPNTADAFPGGSAAGFLVVFLLLSSVTVVLLIRRRRSVSQNVRHVQSKNAIESFTSKSLIKTYVLVGETQGRDRFVFRLRDLNGRKSFLVGRDSKVCDFVINDPSVSRSHARITIENSGLKIEDLGSSNGSFLGTTRIEANGVYIFPGSTFRIGSVVIKLKETA